MVKLFKILILSTTLSVSLFLLEFFSISHAAEKLCLGGVCIGDQMSELGEINWIPARMKFLSSSILVSEWELDDSRMADVLETVTPSIHDEVKPIAAYLAAEQIDSDSIEKIGALKGFCKMFKPWGIISGRFKSKSGHETVIQFGLSVGDNIENQKIQVQKIERIFAQGMTQDQRNGLYDQIKEEYKNFTKSSGSNTDEQEWEFTGSSLELRSAKLGSYISHLDHAGQQKLWSYPGCPGDEKITLD